MARKAWKDLSANQRRRYEKAGITPAQHRAGVSLTAARGHAHTPERPNRERGQKQYARYRERQSERKRLADELKDRKERLFGDRMRFGPGSRVGKAFNRRNSDKYVNRNPQTEKPPPLTLLRRIAAMTDDEIEEIVDSGEMIDDDDWAILYYR